jgi:hypothetical protein
VPDGLERMLGISHVLLRFWRLRFSWVDRRSRLTDGPNVFYLTETLLVSCKEQQISIYRDMYRDAGF